MGPTRLAFSTARHWRVSLPVSLGVVLLLASIVIAAKTIRSHAGDGPSPSVAAAAPADHQSWMALGYGDIEGGVTPLYPAQPGRVQHIDAVEDEPVSAGAPLLHLDDSQAQLKLRQAKVALKAAKKRVDMAEKKLKPFEDQVVAQKQAVAVAEYEVERANLLLKKQRDLQKKDFADTEAVENAEIQVKKAKAGVVAEQKKLAALQGARQQLEGAVALARMDVEDKDLQMQEAQKGVDECILRAPCAGTPLRILVGVGETLGPHPHKSAIEFAPHRRLLVRAEVTQEFVGRIRKNQVVVIQDHITGQDCARGRVASLSRWYAHRRSASPESLQLNNEERTLECLIKIDSTSQELRIGQRVRVRFPDAER